MDKYGKVCFSDREKRKNKMKPTNPNAHTYVEDNDVKVSIMI